jgi:cell fate regulator YaaT (PSP1 superfamily)
MGQDEHVVAQEEHPSQPAAAHKSEGNEPLSPPAGEKRLYQVKVSHSHETIVGCAEGELSLSLGDAVIISSKYGKDLGRILLVLERSPEGNGEDIQPIHRKAGEQDWKRFEANRAKEEQAFRVCQKKIQEHNLEMKLVSTHYLLEEAKVLFFFTADNRIDFRELVKDLVAIFKMRIELRQIGVRDEARVLGGIGICGRAFCCHAVNDHLNPVSIKMAKEQNISLNSLKISGPCGRLLCCLGYEHEFYHCEKKNLPAEGLQFTVNNELFTITEINVLTRTIRLLGNTGRTLSLPFNLFHLGEDGKWIIDAKLLNEFTVVL